MLSVSSKVLRCLLWGVLAVYAAAALACLGLRYWVLPHIDQWRSQIERQASRVVGAQVSIGAISADWSGLNPRLHLSSVRIRDESGGAVALDLPTVDAVLAWGSVLRMAPRLLMLRIDGADLTVRRDEAGKLWVAGLPVDLDAPDTGRPPPLLGWLSKQRVVGIHNSTLRWRDESRQAPELTLSDLDLVLRNGTLSHRFALRARPPAQLAAGLNIRGELDRRLFAYDSSNPESWDGQFYLQLDDAEPSAWAPWTQLPLQAQGRFATRAWLQLERGRILDVTLDGALRGLRWEGAIQGMPAAVSAREASVRISGAPADLLPWLGPSEAARDEAAPGGEAKGQGMAVRLDLRGVETALPEIFSEPALVVEQAQMDAVLSRRQGQPLTVDFTRLRLANDDLDVQLQGRWRDEGAGGAGTADLRGRLVRFSMPAIHRYLPLEVNPDARAWLGRGLLAGELYEADITLKGVLADFPYTAPGSTGQFRVAGSYRDAVVDYAPARPDRKGWPVLEDLGGAFVIDRASLRLDSRGGAVRSSPEHRIALESVQAYIPNMEHDAELSVEGSSAGSAPAYLAVAANSPLGQLLDGSLDEAEATGDWRVPLKLHVPLMRTDDTQVDGRIVFSGGTFRLMPQIPQMSDIQGELEFSEHGLHTRELRGVFLGGPARLSGKLGGSEALAFSGTLSASGLAELARGDAFGLALARRFSGRAVYQGRLAYGKGGEIDISVQSDLAGLGIDLPAPAGKAAADALPLSLQWSPATDKGRPGRRWLSGGLGQNINLLLERDPANRGSYFARGALGVGRAATLPSKGLSLAVTMDALDLDAWDDVSRQLESAAPAKGRAASARSPAAMPTLPGLEQVGLSAGKLTVMGQTLDQVLLYAQRPAPSQWRVTLDSRQTAGTLEWTEASGVAAGKVVARLTRLVLGSADDAADKSKGEPADQKETDLSDIPAIDLQAAQFIMYGHDLGRLDLQGTNLERGNLWRLDKLRISNESATLDATGTWRLRGPERGLTVDTRIAFTNVGGMLERLGQHSVSDGSGTLEGQLTWRNLPWRHDLADITGEVQLSLDKGRFLHVNSRTARLLELLSLQSVQRLASLNFNPAGLLKEGFPFDTVRGDMKLSNGVLSTGGYKVNGPAAAIALEGSTNIVTEQWDLRAVVMPSLDASGAAVAAAFVNPIIGIGAFVTQWLLKQPLAHALSAEYRVTGSWDDPKVEAVASPPPAAPANGPVGEAG